MRNSFKKALNAIGIAAREKSIVFDVVTCVNQKNIHELDEIRELLACRGVSKWRIFTIFAKGRARDNPLLDISCDQFRELLEFIKQTRQNGIINNRLLLLTRRS